MAEPPARSGAAIEGRFRTLVEDLPAITYIADFDGAFTLRYVSPQIRAVLGIEPAANVARVAVEKLPVKNQRAMQKVVGRRNSRRS